MLELCCYPLDLCVSLKAMVVESTKGTTLFNEFLALAVVPLYSNPYSLCNRWEVDNGPDQPDPRRNEDGRVDKCLDLPGVPAQRILFSFIHPSTLNPFRPFSQAL